ncbi:MAG: acyltransferase [Selenomonadaceae bacterium]|nr:acyltransferase [Selenomonadaceae bacterium]
MKKPYLTSIEYIRGVAMLGVVAIHVGSQYLLNPTPNIHLVALFEIVSRFSVPIFFFVSAFGLFYRMEISEPFEYGKFLRRRFKAVLIPYLLWSTFYFVHDNWLAGYELLPYFDYGAEILFFGLAKYHLYFMVILIWFYLLMPLWIFLVRRMSPAKLILLLIAQVAFDFWSSYSPEIWRMVNSLPEGSWLQLALKWRLNWFVGHYVFIFVLGGIFGVHSEKFFAWCSSHKKIVGATFFVASATLLGYYYSLIFVQKFSPLEAVNTAHQLSPAGIFYTIAVSIFLFTLFQFGTLNSPTKKFLSLLGKNSYFVYLAHPLTITYLSLALGKLGLIMTAPNALIFYVAVVAVTLAAAILINSVRKFFQASPR